ncbi:variable lymphocyte receptor [Plakobranchus ocellatus]|uniref:Variable lymphocyte receptor n=1 Tax=Plakobranchus ocellatus TaxID=259542 RepID=A0AAV3Z817_9GAST|nr:variable lymphocyte receptor [Plakobranchus ocellatus]
MKAVCFGPQCALEKQTVPLSRKTRAVSRAYCPKYCNCIRAGSVVSCRGGGLLEIPSQEGALKSADKLYLQDNKITEIRKGVFSRMRTLNYLWLNGNRIKTIENGAFEGLIQVFDFYLRDNLIERIPASTFIGADVPLTKRIYLQNNNLKSIESGAFHNMKELKTIDLSNNRITHISQDAFKGLTNLQELYLYKNLLTSACWVTGNAKSFQSLEWFGIQSNRLKTLPTNLLGSLPSDINLNLEPNPLICDRVLKLIYDALMARVNKRYMEYDLSSWSCENPQNPSHMIKVADLSDDKLEALELAMEDATQPTKLQYSQASPRVGHSQSPLVMICTCTGVFGLLRWSIAS